MHCISCYRHECNILDTSCAYYIPSKKVRKADIYINGHEAPNPHGCGEAANNNEENEK